MTQTSLKILLIEDNPADADLIIDELSKERGTQFAVETATRLDDGLNQLFAGGFDLVLLDLSLPDCRGLETFLRTYRQFPEVPIVVISGLDDLSLAFAAVRSGAQDYLFKGELERSMLVRAVQFAVERHARLQQLNPYLAKAPVSQNRSTEGAETQEPHGTIQATDPALFQMLCDRYRELIEQACKQRLYRMLQNVSSELHGLAMYLCMLHAGPEDAEAIHVNALERLVGEVAPDQASTYVEEAQLLLLELYRYLCDFYRDTALGIQDQEEAAKSKDGQNID